LGLCGVMWGYMVLCVCLGGWAFPPPLALENPIAIRAIKMTIGAIMIAIGATAVTIGAITMKPGAIAIALRGKWEGGF
jgi:hypothetical protein